MVALTARFAMLACLCAALPLVLPPPVEAAYIHSSHSIEKHRSSLHSYQRTRTRDHSSFGQPTAVHGHDGKDHGHQARDRRASELPPLLRRDRVYDHSMAHNPHDQGFHDDPHNKVTQSVFARSRYHHEPAYLSRRSSVYLPGEDGTTYLVSRTPPRNWSYGNTGKDTQSSYAHNRRQVDESSVVLGTVNIMGSTQPSSGTQRLGSLLCVLGSQGLAQNSNGAFALSASATNHTQFVMMPADETLNASGGSNKYVTLAVEVFDPNQAEMVTYCATYDSDPGVTSALLMTLCTDTSATQSAAPARNAAGPCVDDADDTSSNPHESQIFSYDPFSGQIKPISVAASSSGTDNTVSCAGARVRRDNSNSTTSGSVRPSGTSTSTAPTASASQQAQNVTLVFVADALQVPASSPSPSDTTSAGQASVFTRTTTATTGVGVTASGPSSSTVTPARAAVSPPISSTPSPSVAASVSSVFSTATATPSSLSASGSASSTATSGTLANADEPSFEVEIVGIVPSTTTTSSSTSTATVTVTTTATSSVSPSLDPLAVASSIAKARASP